jgi:two-component system heavy metal sensor histidine kinase CusS
MTRRGASVTLRLTLLFAAVSTGVLLALGWLVGRAVEEHFVEQDMELLEGKAHLVAHLLQQVWLLEDLQKLSRPLGDALIGHHGLAAQVLGPGGETVFATPDGISPAAMLSHAQADGRPHTWQAEGRPWRGIAVRLPTGIADMPPLRVAVAVDISHHEHFMAGFRRTLWLFVAVAAALAALLGWAAVRRGLAPLRALREGAAAVTASRLDVRLDLRDVPAEFADLAETLNAMLARLEDSFKRLKEFSSDLAHELRTPISNLMTETQVALANARSADEYREILASNAEEYERLARMVADMLFLAKADHGLMLPSREAIDLAGEVGALFDFYDAVAEEKGIELHCEGKAAMSGDRLMVRRALSNLLSNALRHATGGRVVVRLGEADGAVRVAVENAGEALDPQIVGRLFERFYRADSARTGGDDHGAGLGLAIVKAIAEAHGGSVAAASADGLTRFELRFPATEKPAG